MSLLRKFVFKKLNEKILKKINKVPPLEKTVNISTMKHYVQKLLILFVMFILSSLSAFCAEPVKINSLLFDNSDGIIYIKTKGRITEENKVIKGYLKEPTRVYTDINNAILTTPKKTFNVKNSVFKNVKISQFTTDPYVVRIVFEYDKSFDSSGFEVFKTENAFFIQTKKQLINSPDFKTVYSNTKQKDRTVFYEGLKIEEELNQSLTSSSSTSLNQTNTPQAQVLKIPSKYYIDSITKTKNGVIVNGVGKLSLMPAFTLSEPNRLIVDLDDTVVNPELRNKTNPIGELNITPLENGEKAPDTRETIKIGQNSQNVARIVIQGEGAKNYRGIISPDSKALYFTNKSNIINTKMAETNANLLKSSYSGLKKLEVFSLLFDDSVAFNAFEENSKLYIDINNLNTFDDSLLDPIKRVNSDIQTTRLALDKLRIVFPDTLNKSVAVKTNSNNTEMRIIIKQPVPQVQKPAPTTPSSVFVPVKVVNKKQAEISNLFKVVIDAGHGGSDVGATRCNIYEKDITLKIAKLVEKKLNEKKVKTYMVRDKDKTVSLAERSDFSNNIKPDAFVSIHVNSSTNDTSYGVETHWYKEDSKACAKYVHGEMAKKTKSWSTIDRGLFNSKFYVINHTEAPAILCEIGFISNKKEREEIIKAKRQEETAQAIADGIYKYLKAKK